MNPTLTERLSPTHTIEFLQTRSSHSDFAIFVHV